MTSPTASNGSYRRIRALIKKEFIQIIRDPSSIMVSIVLPLILMFLYGFGVSLDLNHLRIGISLEDNSKEANSFAHSILNSPYFDVTLANDIRELEPLIIKGAIRGIVVIPPYFTEFFKLQKDHQQAPIQVIADGSETNTANFVQNYVAGAWQVWLQQQKISDNLKGLPLASAQTRYWFNEELESRNFLVPGSLAIIMTLTGTLLTALVVAREWERGTMEALMATPISITELLIGKLAPYFCLGIISMSVCVFITVFIYNVPFRGSWIVLALITTIFLFTALGLGLFISTVSKNQFVASQMAIVSAFLPAYMLSGFIFEILSMPVPVQMISSILPARYFVDSLQTLFLAGNIWPLILNNIWPMLIAIVIIFGLISFKTVKRLD